MFSTKTVCSEADKAKTQKMFGLYFNESSENSPRFYLKPLDAAETTSVMQGLEVLQVEVGYLRI